MDSVVIRAEVFTERHKKLTDLKNKNIHHFPDFKSSTADFDFKDTVITFSQAYLFSLDVSSSSSPLITNGLSWLVQQLREGNEVIEEEEPLPLNVTT